MQLHCPGSHPITTQVPEEAVVPTAAIVLTPLLLLELPEDGAPPVRCAQLREWFRQCCFEYAIKLKGGVAIAAPANTVE